MNLTKLNTDVQNITKLDDQPNDTTGLTAAQLKAVFDKAPQDIKDYINNVLIPEAENSFALREELQGIVLNQIPDGTITFEKLSSALSALINGKSDLSNYVRVPGYSIASGSANAYIVTLNPVPTELTDGFAVSVKINATNTGASTIDVNSLGAKTIKNPDGSDVKANDLIADSIYPLRYNGTNFILQGKGGGKKFVTGTVTQSASSATFTKYPTSNGTVNEYYVEFANLTFKPSFIIVVSNSEFFRYCIYNGNAVNSAKIQTYYTQAYSADSTVTNRFINDDGTLVTATSFKLPVNITNTPTHQYTFWAIE